MSLRNSLVASFLLLGVGVVHAACTVGVVPVGDDSADGGESGDASTDADFIDPDGGAVLDLRRTIFSGTYRTCALRSDGAYCWGNIGETNDYHQIFSQTDAPAQTAGHISGGDAIRFPQLDDAVELALTETDTCVRTATNAVRCYTIELFQGGDPAPREMGEFTSIVGGTMSVCGLAAGGNVSCWGEATPSTIEFTPPKPGKDPVAVAGLANVVELASGGPKVCARRADGSVGCWSEWGSLGSTWPDAANTTAVVGASRIAVGYVHACAVISGTLTCWGANTMGELGTGFTDSTDRPATPSLFNGNPRGIALGTAESCALDATGLAWCWGEKYSGSAFVASPNPEAVRLGESYAEISVGDFSYCARRVSDGAVRCWRPGEEPVSVVFHPAGTLSGDGGAGVFDGG